MKFIIRLFSALIITFSYIELAYSKTTKIIIFGDSLIAGYGLVVEDNFVNQLKLKTIENKINDVTLFNSGVSGETSTGLLNRYKWVLEDNYDGVIILIGANDALRGIDPSLTSQNIEKILSYLKEKQIPTMLIGMKAPNNLGEIYVNEFNAIYPKLSKKYDTAYYPFFLKDVALKPSLNQRDMIHPNKKGVKIIVNNFFPYFLEFYESLK
ncbi:MAG: arylesterase [Alphaproteobacteria bacterium]|nr:MAG: arylesterase [Alphaproteobacteria bacterium]